MTVLSVEDCGDTQRIIGFSLEKTPANVVFASSLKEGILMAEELSPDVVLLDLVLPPNTPKETIASISSFGSAAVVILSGSRDPKNMMSAFKNGADSYVNKDVIGNAERLYCVCYNAFMRRTFSPSYCRGNK